MANERTARRGGKQKINREDECVKMLYRTDYRVGFPICHSNYGSVNFGSYTISLNLMHTVQVLFHFSSFSLELLQ